MAEKWWKQYLVDVPPGKLNGVEVCPMEVTKEGASLHNLREVVHGSDRVIVPGMFTALYVQGDLWMSDTPTELVDLEDFRHAIKPGHTVLIHGLGLGCAVKMAFEHGAELVKVIEINPDIIELVGSHWKKRYGGRLEIVQGDALTWRPVKGAHWNVVWHDIWPGISKENVPEMKRLHRRFTRRADWQGSWCRYESEHNRF